MLERGGGFLEGRTLPRTGLLGFCKAVCSCLLLLSSSQGCFDSIQTELCRSSNSPFSSSA